MDSKKIIVDGVPVTCYTDGSVEKTCGRTGELVRQLGYKMKKGYRSIHIAKKNRYVHRLIAAAFVHNPEGLPQVDHINGDKSDNRASNLRWSNNQQNHKGFLRKHPDSSSRWRGVFFDKKDHVWCAQITQNGKSCHIGRYTNEDDAARAYDKKAIELGFSKEALNFPDEGQKLGGEHE